MNQNENESENETIVVRKFPTPLIILFVSLLFAQAEKVGKTAFAQLQLSANQPILINPRKGGIRIQNAILQLFYKHYRISTFRD